MNVQITDEQNSTKWLENLALEEINMEKSGVVHLTEHIDPNHFLEESSIEMMNDLRDLFETHVGKFNEYRGGVHSGSTIKIFKISNTVNDFMLFRNSLRLIFARKSNSLIHIGFLANGKELFPARLSPHDQSNKGMHEIKAHVGPFNSIVWKFSGENVDVNALVRHYLSEFIRHSAA